MEEPDVTDERSVSNKLLERPVAFYDLWRSPGGRLYVCDDNGHVHSTSGKTWTNTKVASGPLTTVWGLDDANVYAAGTEDRLPARR